MRKFGIFDKLSNIFSALYFGYPPNISSPPTPDSTTFELLLANSEII